MESVNKMKVLKGLEKLKYMALLASYAYDKTGSKTYRVTLQNIIDMTWRIYGSKGVIEVIRFIKDERL